MRLLVIGDIHGCATALEVLLKVVDLKAGDKVISLGDYINKGPESNLVLDHLIQLFDQGILLPLRGNHELKLVAAREKGQTQTSAETLVDCHTLASYGRPGQAGCLADIPESHWRFVTHHCLNWVETAGHIFVHATLAADKPLTKQTERALFFDKFNHPLPHMSGKTFICGHTPQKDGNPLNLGHAICLDTAACSGQWLTCLDVFSGRVWQANQQREVRTSWIQDHLKRC